jgi:uncharacterized delta-60 repeat protein
MLNPHALKSSLLRTSIAVALALLLLSSDVLPPAYAAPGDLDLTFGIGGKVITDFAGDGDDALAVVVLPNSQILAAGVSITDSTDFDFALARYNNDGSLDTAFGSGGKVTTDFNGSLDEADAIAIQQDGKIVLAGVAFSIDTFSDFALARYDSDGSLDTTFGSGGKVITEFSNSAGQVSADQAFDMAIQNDGKIVLAGWTFINNSGTSDFALARYNIDGSLDSSFGSGGKVTTDFGGADILRALVIQPDGRIVAAGGGEGLPGGFKLARYNGDGSLDTTFGSDGKVTVVPNAEGRRLVLQPDGKFIVAGEISISFDSNFCLARLSSNGSLDTTFGSGGKVTTDFGGLNDFLTDIAIQPDGRIVAVGTPPTRGGAIVRYNGDGSLDSSFGSGGIVTIDLSIPTSSFNSVAIEGTGKIIIAGRANDLDLADFALARYEGDGFDICIHDDNNGNLLQFNSRTGSYQFSNCRKGFSLTGSGSVIIRFCKIELQDVERDRNISALVNTCTHAGTASVRDFSRNQTFTMTDRDITNNSCSCR